MKNKIKHYQPITFIKVLALLVTVFCLINSCTKDSMNLTNDENGSSPSLLSTHAGKIVLEMNYEVETTTSYIAEGGKHYNSLDFATMTPNCDRQKVNLSIYDDGQLAIEMVKLKERYPIEIHHQNLRTEKGKAHRIVCRFNQSSVFDESGKLLSTSPVELPNQKKTVENIKKMGNIYSQAEINNVLASMQGQKYAANLEQFIANASKIGIRVVQQNERFVTLRMPLLTTGIKSSDELVLLVDRKLNRLAGTRVYDGKNEIKQTTMFGYGPPDNPYLAAIKQTNKDILPSGKEVIRESITRIENIKVQINK